MHDIQLRDVVENREFYRLEPGFLGRQKILGEIDLLEYGLHLLRVELFRLRLFELGVKEAWISQHAPDFIQPQYHPKTSRDLIHQNLLRQIEYLRADVIVAAARLSKRSLP